MKVTSINIGRDFNEYPVGRYRKDGDANGEKFREDFLKKPLQEGSVHVLLDDAFGYGSSFLEEAFGGLVRSGLTVKELEKTLVIVSDDESLKKEIWSYIKAAKKGDK
ncbi:MAG: STAS-like domain-containing protein [Xanthomonadales bacterium]|nr:STAS-like domain-containing protein [Xanthomonadales bacterium]